jgi:hypothetical protein
LASGHSINAIVDNDGCDIDVSSGRMDEMVPSDGHSVAIPHDDDHFQAGLGEFYSGGKGESPAMGGVKGIEIDIDRQPSGTTYPGDEDNLIFIITNPVNGANEAAQQDSDPAPRTPDMREFFVMPQIFMDQLGDFGHQETSLKNDHCKLQTTNCKIFNTLPEFSLLSPCNSRC